MERRKFSKKSAIVSCAAAITPFYIINAKSKTDKPITGGEAPTYTNGMPKQMTGNEKHLTHPHDVCIDRDENVYVCQWNSHETYPILLERV